MLGYNTAKAKGKSLYSSLSRHDEGPQSLKEWWEEVIIIAILALAGGTIAWLLFFKTYGG